MPPPYLTKEDGEEDEFDSLWENLPQSTLAAIERNAIVSTQGQAERRTPTIRPKQYNHVTKPYKLSVPSNSRQIGVSQPPPPAPPQPPPPPRPESPASDSSYGYGNEDVIDLDEESLFIEPASEPPPPRKIVENSTVYDSVVQDNADHNHAEPHPHLAALRARVDQLERDRIAQQEAKERAEATALKTAGEIAIIRAKHQRELREYERKIAVQEALHKEQKAKQDAEIEAARKAREKIETDSRFREHELAQELAREVERRKRIKASSKETTSVSAPAPFPQNSRQTRSAAESRPHMDGFDDHEILLVSPSKPKDKAKPDTPKAGDKRKRNVVASPARPLRLTGLSPASAPRDVADHAPMPRHNVRDSTFQIMQQILHHRPAATSERTLDSLSQHSFRSLPNKSIASLVLDGLAHYHENDAQPDLCTYVCNVVFDLWDKILAEQDYASLSLLLHLFEFTLGLASTTIQKSLLDRVVPLCQASIDLVVLPAVQPWLEVPPDAVDAEQLANEIDVDHILSILHNTAMSASLSLEAKRMFWQKMEFDFMLIMLNVPQQLPHIILMLHMLSSSVRPDSFGVLARDVTRQADLETYTIDRLTNLLFERPRAPKDEPPYEDSEVAALNIETVQALRSIARTKHGSLALAQHRMAIGRLLRFLHNQVASLYDMRPWNIDDCLASAMEGMKLSAPSVHQMTSQIINLTTHLLYHVIQTHPDIVIMHDKTTVVPGGHQKLLVSLSRLAFSEQLLYEAGIDEETIDAAHEILDGAIGPKEGEAVMQAIETPRGTDGPMASGLNPPARGD